MTEHYDHEDIGGINIIANGTILNGNINTSGDCRIDGKMKGNIESKSKIIIGETGMLEGDIICRNIEIAGRVKANINVAELLTLKASAILNGNIVAGKIAIEPGANFVGNCKMHNGNNDVEPENPPVE